MDNLLIEIRTEEIPAGYIEPALKALSSELLKKLGENRIEHGASRIYGTPRRLAVEVFKVEAKQKSLTTEIIGPPERVGFDSNGNPTVAAKKFAEKVGVSVDRLSVKKTNKGTYLSAKKTERGIASRTILKQILPSVILSTPFPKTMRWADMPIAFVRPIHSILALLGSRIISFSLGNVKSGRYTCGHSFMDPGRIKIDSPENYTEKLRRAWVMVDIDERRKTVYRGITKTAEAVGGRVLPDNELLGIVANLVEYPVPVVGRFEEKFLDLPKEILITAMREHQKYFAVIDGDDNLMPNFIAVNNTIAKDLGLVTKGHERVLRARLEDARFFYHSDLDVSLDTCVEKLNGVMFQARLGTIYKKVLRLQQLVNSMADALGLQPDSKKHLLRAAFLCKADLVSQVVGEFPKLQGIMGRVYASAANETADVATAIEEHYRPTYSGGPLPEKLTGAILGIADKMDSICGCFSVGLAPTGTADPYALRRQGIGIIQIMLDKGFSFSLRAIIEKSLKLFDEKNPQKMKLTSDSIYSFLQNRMAHLLLEDGFSKDTIAAVLSVSGDIVPNVWKKVHALTSLKTAPDFEPLAVAFKRVVNIIKQADLNENGLTIGEVDENLFRHESEFALYSAYQKVAMKVDDHLTEGLFDQALKEIATLRDSVDAFFDGVMVLTEDVNLRNNRLSLLRHISLLFEKYADFSKVST